jgi:hypothetical protein
MQFWPCEEVQTKSRAPKQASSIMCTSLRSWCVVIVSPAELQGLEKRSVSAISSLLCCLPRITTGSEGLRPLLPSLQFPLRFHLHHVRIQIALVQNILGRLELGLGAPNRTASKGSDGKPLRTHVQDLLANRLFLSRGYLIFCYSAVLSALTRLEIEDCCQNLREDADLWDRGQAPQHLARLSKLRKLHLGVEVPCQNRTELLLACSSLTALEVCALASMQCNCTSPLLSVIGEK